jgi:ADP-heptose:LPS heptosyltransferase
VELVLLQVGGDRDQSKPWDQYVSDWLPDSADFAATAATVAELDLVISVDTSTAHLVGAMGRRCWLLLPYSAAPRWLRWRCDTPWYPGMRLYRQQSSGDWRSVVERVLLHMSVALRDSAAAI